MASKAQDGNQSFKKEYGVRVWGAEFPGSPVVQDSAFSLLGEWVQSQGQEDPLEEGMATYSSILAWRISWTEEPDGLLMGL